MKFLTRLLICLILMGNLPISDSGFVHAESAEQQKKKKKKKKPSSKKKKKSSSKKKKKSSSKKKKKSSSKKKKKPSSKKKKKKSKESVAEPIESASTINNKPRINSAAYADELFNLTGELQASNRELARATRYYYNLFTTLTRLIIC